MLFSVPQKRKDDRRLTSLCDIKVKDKTKEKSKSEVEMNGFSALGFLGVMWGHISLCGWDWNVEADVLYYCPLRYVSGLFNLLIIAVKIQHIPQRKTNADLNQHALDLRFCDLATWLVDFDFARILIWVSQADCPPNLDHNANLKHLTERVNREPKAYFTCMSNRSTWWTLSVHHGLMHTWVHFGSQSVILGWQWKERFESNGDLSCLPISILNPLMTFLAFLSQTKNGTVDRNERYFLAGLQWGAGGSPL